MAVSPVKKLFHNKEDNNSGDHVIKNAFTGLSHVFQSFRKQWMKAPPISAPHEKPTRTVMMRLSKVSLKPMNKIPIKEIKITMVTDMRMTVRSAISL